MPPPGRKDGKPSTPAPGAPVSHQRIPSPMPSSVPPPSSEPPPALQPIVLKGIAGSPGVAVGPAVVLDDVREGYARRHIHGYQVLEEISRVQHAVEGAKKSLIDVAARLSPFLVPWEQVPKDIQKYDFDAIVALPKKLRELGLEIEKA